MGSISSTLALGGSTYREIVSRPFYYVILLLLAGMIALSRFVTLFSFHQETNMVREMGIATTTFFAVLVTLILSGSLVTRELENRTAITLLSKPVTRSSFLVGKFIGLLLAILPGIIILSGVLILTLWWMTTPTLYQSDALMWKLGHPGEGGAAIPVMTHGQSLFHETAGCLQVAWKFSLQSNGLLVLQGAILSFFHGAILAAICISLSAFFPVPVSISATSVLFILGNLSGYMVASVEAWNNTLLSYLAVGSAHVLPNLGYFNLQTHFSEGRIVSTQYMGFSALYAVLYCFAVFLLACAAFRRREIR